MTTTLRTCEVCDRRFTVTPAHRLTCSAECRLDLAARRARHRQLIAWSHGLEPAPQTTPNRAHAALTETRAAVAQLLAEGRRARLTSDRGESA